MSIELGVKGDATRRPLGDGAARTATGGGNLHRLHAADPYEPEPADEVPDFARLQFQEIEVSFDAGRRTVWCHLRPDGPPSFTPGLLRELNVLHHAMQAYIAGHAPSAGHPIHYYVQGSRVPGIYNMGGDLGFLTQCVRNGDREVVRRYAYDCITAVHGIATGFNSSVVSVGLIQGDALGGGLEGALCCNVLVAERSVKMGLPEILFHSFPGMGAYSFLSRRIGLALTERMITSGRIYSAEEMRDMGVVDMVADDGDGEAVVDQYIGAGERDHSVRQALFRVRQRVAPVTIEELRDVTDIWVDTMMRLPAADLRRMELLQQAQVRRLTRAATDETSLAAE